MGTQARDGPFRRFSVRQWEKKTPKAFFRGARTTDGRDAVVFFSDRNPELLDAAYTANCPGPPFPSSTVNRFSMAVVYAVGGRLTALLGGFGLGQTSGSPVCLTASRWVAGYGRVWH
jgi:hypothetical protein